MFGSYAQKLDIPSSDIDFGINLIIDDDWENFDENQEISMNNNKSRNKKIKMLIINEMVE